MSLQTPDKSAFTLVQFKYGDPDLPVYARYTDDTKDHVHLGDNYASTPELDVKLPGYTGVFKEKDCAVALPTDDFAEMLSSGDPTSPVWASVYEVISGDATRLVFYGRVVKAIRNYQGRRHRTLIEAQNFKGQLDVPIGVIATHQCFHIFGKRGCRVQAQPEVGTITAIAGNVATITGLSAHVNNYWHRGYVRYQGIQVSIREWVSGTAFTLVRRPPVSWLNQPVVVFPGCDRTIETCRAIWNNEAQFGGFGYAIVHWNPLFEKP